MGRRRGRAEHALPCRPPGLARHAEAARTIPARERESGMKGESRRARPRDRRRRDRRRCRDSRRTALPGRSRSCCSPASSSARSRSWARRTPPAQSAGVPVESLLLPRRRGARGTRRDPHGPGRDRARAGDRAGGRPRRPRARDGAPAGPGEWAAVQPRSDGRADRGAVIGFLGFAGIATLVPGGLPVPGAGRRDRLERPGGRRPGRRRRGHRVPAGLPGRRAARRRTCATSPGSGSRRGGGGDRRRRASLDRDPARPRPGAPRAGVLPVGRDPQRRRRSAAATAAGLGDGARWPCWRSS